MSAEHLDEMELRFEEIARMQLPLLFKFAEELEMDLGGVNRKTQVLRKLRECMYSSWGENEDSRISYMERRAMVTLDRVLAARCLAGDPDQ